MGRAGQGGNDMRTQVRINGTRCAGNAGDSVRVELDDFSARFAVVPAVFEMTAHVGLSRIVELIMLMFFLNLEFFNRFSL